MASLASYLESNGKYIVCNVSYASTRQTLDQHASALNEIIAALDGIDQIDLVGHSLGSIVIRRYLKRTTDPSSGRQGDPRIGRIVMIGPPNRGARLARLLNRLRLYKFLMGPSAVSLAGDAHEFSEFLAIPQAEFGIIAGRGGFAGYNNPWLPGENDFIVGVEETRLKGAKDLCVVEATHAFMMDQPLIQQATLQFLQTGRFIQGDSDGQIR
jgi:pimeloyl-ACP methyl ester carboxylesterase